MTVCAICRDPAQRHTYTYPPDLCCQARMLADTPARLRRAWLLDAKRTWPAGEWRELVDAVKARIEEENGNDKQAGG